MPIDTHRYRESSGDSANLLIKVVQAQGVMTYFDNSGQIILPSKLLEQAAVLDDPKFPFSQVQVPQIHRQMACVFEQSKEARLQNPYIIFDAAELNAHIFSFRHADYDGLYQYLINYFERNPTTGNAQGPNLHTAFSPRVHRSSFGRKPEEPDINLA